MTNIAATLNVRDAPRRISGRSTTASARNRASMRTRPRGLPPTTSPPIVDNRDAGGTRVRAAPAPLGSGSVHRHVGNVFSRVRKLRTIDIDIARNIIALTKRAPGRGGTRRTVGLAGHLASIIAIRSGVGQALSIRSGIAAICRKLGTRIGGLIGTIPLLLINVIVFKLIA